MGGIIVNPFPEIREIEEKIQVSEELRGLLEELNDLEGIEEKPDHFEWLVEKVEEISTPLDPDNEEGSTGLDPGFIETRLPWQHTTNTQL